MERKPNSNTKIAKELLQIAKILIAGDAGDAYTLNDIFKPQKRFTHPQVQRLKQVLTPPKPKAKPVESNDNDDAMDKVAEELLGIANELINEGNMEQE